MFRRLLQPILGFCALVAVVFAGWWFVTVRKPSATEKRPSDAAPVVPGSVPVRLTKQAQKNLGLVTKPLAVSEYWRTIEMPAIIEDRPGISDRGVVTPITGVVTKIHAFPGNSVAPKAPLFSIRLVSESLHASQLELFKATKEIEIARRQQERLADAAEAGAVPQSRIIELKNQIDRLDVSVQAYQQDLQSRGLPPDRIEAAAKGEFLTEMVVYAPGEEALKAGEVALASHIEDEPGRLPFTYELQTLKVELGQQVEAGEVLCTLADHRALFIEGRGFEDDMPLLQEAARNGWEIEVDFEESKKGNWPPLPGKLRIQHVANIIDSQSRTFAFYLPLENQWQTYVQDGETRLLWRFRPGMRVRLRVPVERFDNVIVVPHNGVVREGPDAFVFRQNGELFDRRPVHVMHEDSRHSVLANDGSLRPGQYIAQNAAASLNRVLKAQASSGMPANVHVHADGTVHAAH